MDNKDSRFFLLLFIFFILALSQFFLLSFQVEKTLSIYQRFQCFYRFSMKTMKFTTFYQSKYPPRHRCYVYDVTPSPIDRQSSVEFFFSFIIKLFFLFCSHSSSPFVPAILPIWNSIPILNLNDCGWVAQGGGGETCS